MPTNVYFDHDYSEEQNLYQDLVIEALQIYGQQTFYIPRDVVRRDEILNEDFSRFSEAFNVEMYIENTTGFEGDGTLLSKFGLEIRDQANFIVAKKQFRKLVDINQGTLNVERPREGDLIYLPLSNSLFQIKFVEHEQPFYQLRNLPTYQLQCEMFEYSSEEFNTGIDDIDRYEALRGTPTVIRVVGGTDGFGEGDTVRQITQGEFVPEPSNAEGYANVDLTTGKITGITITAPGYGYLVPPDVTIPAPEIGEQATAEAVIDSEGKVTGFNITNPGSGYVGDIFVFIEESIEETEDSVPEVFVTADVTKFVETQEADPVNSIRREGDLYLVNVKSSDGTDSGFIINGNPLENISYTDHPNDWVIDDIYDIEDEGMYIPEDIDPLADNDRYEIDADQILDFSEQNPFGEPT